jgi:4'-phosphopantetheinyl transferase
MDIKVDVFYTKFKERLPNHLWEDYMDFLPADQQNRVFKYRRWQDQYSYLFGRLLLLEGLKRYSTDKSLKNIDYDEYNKPFISNSTIQFNISHSGEYVICAITEGYSIGVDIEKVDVIGFENFTNVLSSRELNYIRKSSRPLKSFYELWVRKESVVKADRRGLTIPLSEINIQMRHAYCYSEIWYLTELSIDKNYCACLAIGLPNPDISINRLDFYK